MTPERIDELTSRLNDLDREWQNGHSFDIKSVQYLPTQPAAIALVEELKIVGNVYGLTFRHNGDYCWFDVKTDENDK